MRVFYNDNEDFVCAWLSNLMDAGHITPGTIDDRSITDIQPEDVEGYDRVHLFAGIGGWELALGLARWGDRPVWTASCPCPPFSVAGKPTVCPQCEGRDLVWCPRRTGFAICATCGHTWTADGRHLWPEVWRLAARCRPGRIFGEQVASTVALDWWAAVQASLEILGYDSWAQDRPASSVGAPHIRQRLWWVAHAGRIGVTGCGGHVADDAEGRHLVSTERRQGSDGVGENGASGSGMADAGCTGENRRIAEEPRRSDAEEGTGQSLQSGRCGDIGRVGVSDGAGRNPGREASESARHGGSPVATGGMGDTDGRGQQPRQEAHEEERQGHAVEPASDVGDTDIEGLEGHAGDVADGEEPGWFDTEPNGSVAESSVWGSAVAIPCADGKSRLIEPGSFPLAHGVPGRVGQLRAYGNAIVPQVAAAFIKDYMDVI